MVFYPAYAYHRWVQIKDIELDKPFDVYEDARKYAHDLLCDDDDCGVFTKINDEWHKVFRRDKESGKLLVIPGDVFKPEKAYLV